MEPKANISSDNPVLDAEIIELEAEDMGVCPEGFDPVQWDEWKNWKMRPANDFIFQVKRGMQGLNTGLGNGLVAINRYTYGTHQARYYLVGADSSVGKTTIADFMFVIKAWRSAKAKGRPIKIFYCSFEVGKLDKVARWVSYFIYEEFGMRLPSDYILGRIEGKLVSKEHEKIIMKGYAMVLEMMKDINFVEDVIHPTKIFEDLIEAHFAQVGTVTRSEVSAEDKAKGRKGYVKAYQPNDPNLVTLLVIDHLALTGHEQKLDTKQIMDRMSKYGIILRNIFHCTCVFIQQFSTDLMSFHRTNKKNPQSIAPQRLDFGDSKATFRDADVVFGLLNPLSYDFDKFLGYELINGDECLGQCFRALYLMKNRYGPSSRVVPLFLDGVTGTVYDLPVEGTNQITMQPWYNKANEIEAICQQFSPSQPFQ